MYEDDYRRRHRALLYFVLLGYRMSLEITFNCGENTQYTWGFRDRDQLAEGLCALGEFIRRHPEHTVDVLLNTVHSSVNARWVPPEEEV